MYSSQLEPIDTPQSQAFGYREAVAIERYAYDQAIARDDDPKHVDHNARTVEVLWKAKVALDAHPTGLWLPFTIWIEKAGGPDLPVILQAIREPGDMGETTVTIALSDAVPFTVNPTAPNFRRSPCCSSGRSGCPW